MADKIFLIQADSTLITVNKSPFESEDIFQQLLATFPDLLAGDQVRPSEPRKWLLVAREVDVPDSEDGGSRWSLDHLYLDQDGVPTLVEVKRSSDTRLRREVVGQLLDYAANAVAHWPASEIRNQFERRCTEEGLDADEEIERFLDDDDLDAAWFWERVKTNLQARKVRMLFAADRIPRELRRIIEFLNEQMDPAEVLGLELKHHAGGNVRVLVPEVIGRTEAASSRKGTEQRTSRQWDRETLLDDIEERHGTESKNFVAEFLEWCDRLDYQFIYGKGRDNGRCSVILEKRDGGEITKYPLINVWTPRATLGIDLNQLGTRAEFEEPDVAEKLKAAALQIPGSSLSPKGYTVDVRIAEGEGEAKIVAAKKFVTWLANTISGQAGSANDDLQATDDGSRDTASTA